MKLFYKNIRIILLLLSAIFIHAQADESITEKLEDRGYLYVRETHLTFLFEDEEGHCGFIDKKVAFFNSRSLILYMMSFQIVNPILFWYWKTTISSMFQEIVVCR